eukprot:6184191-Pyramimonas_sp.AAC.1
MDSHQRLIHQPGNAPHGHQLASTMAAVASGGCWPRERKQQQLAHCAGDLCCDRCGIAPETLLHRHW